MSSLDKAGNLLRVFWKPNGKTPDEANTKALVSWMGSNGLLTDSGNLTAFISKAEFGELRKAALKALKPKTKANKYELSDIPTEAEANQVVLDFESEGCKASKKQQSDGKWSVTAVCPIS